MRPRWLIPPILVFAAALPARAQRAEVVPPDSGVAAVAGDARTVPDSAAVPGDTVRRPRGFEAEVPLRLGLQPIELPFPILFAPPPGSNAYWARPRIEDWVAEWSRAMRAQSEARLRTWLRTALADTTSSPDTVAYLPPPPPPKDTARATGVPGKVGEYADLGMQIVGRGEMGGQWTRFRPCDSYMGLGGCDPGLIPRLNPDVQFALRVGGTISDRIHVDVDYDQRREFDAANNIHVYYQGFEDEILQRVEVGDVSIALPPSRYITRGVPAGNFGFKATGALGPLDFQAVWAQQKGDISTREFRLGGAPGQEGLVQDAELVLDDADYVKGQFFFVVHPDSIAGAPHIDILALTPGGADAPPSLRPATGTLQLYRDERPSLQNQQQQAQLGYFPADATVPGSTTVHTGLFKLLIPGEDYLVHSSGLWIMLRSPLRADEALAVSYVTASGDTVGTPNAELAEGKPTLRLLRPPLTVHTPDQPTWRFEMHQVYRLDNSSTVDPSAISLEISLGEASGGITHVDVGGKRISLLKLFGMDEDTPEEQLDAVQIYQPDRELMGGSTGRIGGTYVVFPTLEPFRAPPAVPSAGLTAEQVAAALGANLNHELYTNPDPVIRDGSVQYRLNFKYRAEMQGVASSIELGAFGIREGSEKVTVGGRTLVRGQDYTIDYDLGILSLTDPQAVFGAQPDAEIRATWEQKSLFQIAPTSIFAMNIGYDLGARGQLDFTGLYQAEKSVMSRPQLGLEPASAFIGGASGRLDLGGAWLDRALDRIPGLDLAATSSVRLSGEMALSLPNPNTRGITYVDDFEASDSDPISLHTSHWRLGSRPDETTGAANYFPAVLDVASAAPLIWQHTFLANGQTAGWLSPADIDTQIRTTRQRFDETVLWLSFGDAAAPGTRRWRSMTTVLETTGRDLTRAEYLEFYVRAPAGHGLALVFDIGTVGEDAFYFDEAGRTNGVYEGDGGAPWGLGILDEEARVLDREIWGTLHDQRGLWDQPCSGQRGATYPLGDPRANCTRSNGRPDTEDLDGNGILSAADGQYFRYVVPLDEVTEYLVRDAGAGGTGTQFRLYRIPLRGAGATPIGASDATWRYIKHLRLSVTGVTSDTTRLGIARMRFVGSRWSKREVHGIIGGLLGTDPGAGAASTRLQVGPVSLLTDDGYVSPPGVSIQPSDLSSGFGATGVEFTESSLRLAYESLAPDERGEVYYRYPQQPRNLLSYRQMRFWAVARAGSWGATGTERLLVKVGTDAHNYYLYRMDLREAPANGVVRAADWVEGVIDFEAWFRLRAAAEEVLLARPDSARAGEPVVVWSEDSTYAVVMGDRALAPNLAAVRELSFSVYNGGGLAASGEVWVDELVLTGGVTDPGTAGHVNLDVRGGDFLAANVTYSNQGAHFRQLSQDATYQTTGNLSASGSVQLGKLAPASWGVNLPVRASYVRTGQDPLFLDRSDLRADRLRGLRSTGSSSLTLDVTLSKRTPSANPLASVLLDGTQLTLGYKQAETGSIRSRNTAGSLDGTLSYDRRVSARDFGFFPAFLRDALAALAPGFIERSNAFRRLIASRLRWTPDAVSFSTSYGQRETRDYRFNDILDLPGDTAVTPVESGHRALRSRARVAMRPFESLTAGVTLESNRDLLPTERATNRPLERGAIDAARSELAGIDLGWETDRALTTDLDFQPRITDWLVAGFGFDARYRTSRNASYIETQVTGDDTTAVLQRGFEGSRQLSRTLRLQPSGLVTAVLGRPAEGEGRAARLLRGTGTALQPLSVTWTSSLDSRFERETFEPGTAYRFGLGSFDSFRLIDGDTAATAQERHQFQAESGLRLPWDLQLRVRYVDGRTRGMNARTGGQTRRERSWPDLQLAWTNLPIPLRIRRIVPQASFSTGYQASTSSRLDGGDVARESGRDARSIPVQFRMVLTSGLSASYSGTFTDEERRDPTGNAESNAATHAIQLSGRVQPPASLRESLPNPIQLGLRLGHESQFQCRIAATRAAGECTPIVDQVNRSVNLTLDTLLEDLTVGFQMSWTDRQSRIGVGYGSTQFQLGIFGSFNFTAGQLPATGMR